MLDLLFFEFLRIVFWFNPLVYVYQIRISSVHEYLADAGIVKNVKKQDYFQQLLNTAFNTEDISFINQFFNYSIIKKRIIMLQKNKSRSVSKFKFLIILPLMLAMLTYVSCSEDPVAEPTPKEVSVQEKLEEVRVLVENGRELTEAEKETVWEIMSSMNKEELYKYLNTKNSPQRVRNEGTGDVPFAVIDEVPVFPGCEALRSNEDRKSCMSEKVTDFVNKNFDTSLGKQLNLKGLNRVYVQFRIEKGGTVKILGARAPHPALEEEAKRVINLLPQMTPGKQNGQEVGVLYSLPITFQAGE